MRKTAGGTAVFQYSEKNKIENQGKLFEYAQDHCPGMDIEDFIDHYMNSRTRALIDEGQAYVSTMDAESLFDYFLKNDKYELKQGKEAGGFAPDWIGQFYSKIRQLPKRY